MPVKTNSKDSRHPPSQDKHANYNSQVIEEPVLNKQNSDRNSSEPIQPVFAPQNSTMHVGNNSTGTGLTQASTISLNLGGRTGTQLFLPQVPVLPQGQLVYLYPANSVSPD